MPISNSLLHNKTMTTDIIYYDKLHRELTAENMIGCLIKNEGKGGESHALNMHKCDETSVPTQKAQFRIVLNYPGYAYLKTSFKLE